MEYQTTKHVCEGCGGELSAIKIVDNSGLPTFRTGCERCSFFRVGVDRTYFRIARKLVEEGRLLPYSHICRIDYEDTPERLKYFFDSQTAGLSHEIANIHALLRGG